MKKAVIYINQFFAGIGGEEFADHKPEIREGLIGPALAVNTVLKNAEITHTIICGDNYMGSNTEDAIAQITEMLEGLEFDIFFAGPAFQAGRYGVACGTICKSVKEKFNVEVITSMHAENPGVDMFKKDMYIFSGGKSAAAMRKDAKKMAALGDKILDGETAFLADEYGFFKRGIRHQVWLEDGRPAADRAIEMLLKKVNGQPFQTELPIPKVDRVPIAAPVVDLTKVRIALVTTGGIVPVENPDRIQSASATRWGRYDISQVERLEGGVYKTIHAGYDPAAADTDPNVCVPVDVMKEFEKTGVIGKLDDYFYTTVGTGTTEAEAQRMAKEMIPFMKQDGVDAIIMTSTWGTCTRCGATMVKEFERAGYPIVQMCNLIPVAKTVGANKIVPTISIPYPLGDPSTSKEEQWKLRHHRVSVALEALTTDVKEQTVFKVKK